MDLNGKCICLPSSSIVAVPKTHNIERDFEMHHSSFAKSFLLDSEVPEKQVKF